MNKETFTVKVDRRNFEIDTGAGAISIDGVQINASVKHISGQTYSILVNGRSHEFTVESNGSESTITGIATAQNALVLDRIALLLDGSEAATEGPHATSVHAPMPGMVLKIEVAEGQRILSGAGLLVLEAMKMENEIFSSGDAVVENIHVHEGEAVTKGQLLVTLS